MTSTVDRAGNRDMLGKRALFSVPEDSEDPERTTVPRRAAADGKRALYSVTEPPRTTAPPVDDRRSVVDGVCDVADPVALVRALARAVEGAAHQPSKSLPAAARAATGLATVAADLVTRTVGVPLPGVAELDPKDTRFSDPAWRENPFFHAVLQAYMLAARLVNELVDTAELEAPTASKAKFAAKVLTDALAPTNCLLTNPTAWKRAFDTAGKSVLRGGRALLRDLTQNEGWPSQVDRTAFRLGEHTAATPGKVVFRNELIELIQYSPQTDDVYKIPLVFIPPWINKYYIADLAPGKSLVEWAVQHGHTVFALSFRNPDESLRDLSFDDYLRLGPLTAVDVARSIAGTEVVNTISICLGGTMTAMMLAYHDACGDRIVNSATLLNSALDYRDAGVLAAVFSDPQTIEEFMRRMEKTGYVDGKDVAHAFDLLRANDLVFRYVVDNWLLGEDPPAFDLLAWNADSTKLPGKTHAHFLHEMYSENSLPRDEFVLLGERLAVSEITNDVYIVAAADDYIVPWQTSYKTTQLLKGPIRFVLTSAGHIAGIVNPPHPKARLWTNDELPPDPDRWRAGAVEHRDTWWNDWAAWIATRSGERVAPPSIGNQGRPVLEDAPGSYVRG
jgi:polyhydroxyalkanoate synthase